jgi:Adenylate and Guanylate cyclase catalytic domain
VNKASRIETSGSAGRIHLSQETADLVTKSGRGHWLTPRNDVVDLKGLGIVQTYWLKIKGEIAQNSSTVENSSDTNSTGGNPEAHSDDFVSSPSLLSNNHSSMTKAHQTTPLNWHKEVLGASLRKIIALRNLKNNSTSTVKVSSSAVEKALTNLEADAVFAHGTPGDCIVFPTIPESIDWGSVELDEKVESQLEVFVKEIIESYNPNPFHNINHASHVCLGVTKLLRRMEAIGELSLDDPMTQFVVILTALIHGKLLLCVCVCVCVVFCYCFLPKMHG